MKKTLIIVLSLMTGCVYSPRDSHSTTHYHYDSPNKQESSQNPFKRTNEQYNLEQYNQRPQPQLINDAPFYGEGLAPKPQYRQASVDVGQRYYQPNPYYTTVPHPFNRTVYFVENRY